MIMFPGLYASENPFDGMPHWDDYAIHAQQVAFEVSTPTAVRWKSANGGDLG